MKRLIAAVLLCAVAIPASAARVRVRRGPAGRVHVAVRPGFPISRTLPAVIVRPGASQGAMEVRPLWPM